MVRLGKKILFWGFLLFAVTQAYAENLWKECAVYYHEGDIPAFDVEYSRVGRERLLQNLPWKFLPPEKKFTDIIHETNVSNFSFFARAARTLNRVEDKEESPTYSPVLWIKILLPQSSLKNAALYLPAVEHKFELYSYGRRIYRFGDIRSDAFEGRPYHTISLGRSTSRELYLRIRLSHTNAKPIENPVYASIGEITEHQMVLNVANAAHVALFIVMGIISCVFFLFDQRTRYFLFHGLASLFVAGIVITRGKMFYMFIDDYLLLYYVQCWALYLFVIFMELFVSRYLKDKRAVIVNNFWIFHLFIIVLITLADIAGFVAVDEGYFFFESTIIPAIIVFAVFSIKKLKQRGESLIVGGIIVFLSLSMYEILADLSTLPMAFPLSDTGYMIFLVTYFMSGIMKIMRARDELSESNKKLFKAYDDLVVSNQRNRIIIENSVDLYFSLNRSFRLISINAPLKRYISSFKEDQILITELLYLANGEKNRVGDILLAQLQLLVEKGEPVTLKTTFQNIWTSEPEEISLRFELVTLKNTIEIIGCGKRASEDILNRYFVSEKLCYQVQNHLVLAEEISYRITRNMVRYLPQREVNITRIALRELIANSIEHGNLGVTFDEKTKYGAVQKEYLEFLASRRAQSPYSGRKVTVEFSVRRQGACFVITDEGDGFDYENALVFNSDKINGAGISHGRGLKIANEVFDKLEFSSSGRRVTALKFF